MLAHILGTYGKKLLELLNAALPTISLLFPPRSLYDWFLALDYK